MVTLSIEIPDEALEIPGLGDSLAWFVTEQIKINEWRKRRYGGGLEAIVEAAFQEAARLRSAGISPENARKQFLEQWHRLAE